MFGDDGHVAEGALEETPARLSPFLRLSLLAPRFLLPPWPAATVGGLLGFVVGWVIAASMRRHQFFTAAYQPEIISAALIVLWVLIGVLSGLTVLSPEEEV